MKQKQVHGLLLRCMDRGRRDIGALGTRGSVTHERTPPTAGCAQRGNFLALAYDDVCLRSATQALHALNLSEANLAFFGL